MAVCIYIFDDQMLFNNNTTPATFRHIAHKSQQQRQINVIYVCTYTHAEEWHGYRDGWENGMLGVGGRVLYLCVWSGVELFCADAFSKKVLKMLYWQYLRIYSGCVQKRKSVR